MLFFIFYPRLSKGFRSQDQIVSGAFLDHRQKHIAHPAVIFVDHVRFLLGEHLLHYQVPFIRAAGKDLEGIELAEFGLGCLGYGNKIFYSDAVASFLLEAGFIAQDHAGLKRNGISRSLL